MALVNFHDLFPGQSTRNYMVSGARMIQVGADVVMAAMDDATMSAAYTPDNYDGLMFVITGPPDIHERWRALAWGRFEP